MVPRSGRRPLDVQVLTSPALVDCWSVNLSATGIGLEASGSAAPPKEGDTLELDFALPGAGRIRARAVVRWCHADVARGPLSLGLSFSGFDGADQARLARYLSTHQLQVALAFADPEQVLALVRALGNDAQVHTVSSVAELAPLLRRGDLSAVAIAGSDEGAAVALAREVAGSGGAADLAPRVVFCAQASPATLVELFNAGAVFRSLPFDAVPVQGALLEACRERGVRTEQRRMGLELERNLLRDRALSTNTPAHERSAPGFGSPRMKEILSLLQICAPHRVPILLQGETGTGKEVLARCIHRLSGQGEVPFVVQDCGALTETLLESELFGHVKGAFTGAVADHPGLFVLGDGGTLFLDEIENTTPNLQAKLLRVIETGDVRPVGGTQVRHVDVRVIAASNRDLAAEVRAGSFRSDLFYRLNTFTVDIPPLRERREDILPLARHFLAQFNAALQRTASGLAPEVEEVLLSSEWPGNVRELRNVVERAVLLSQPGQLVPRALLPPAMAKAASPEEPSGALKDRLAAFEKELLREALARNAGVLRRAATDLGMDPVTFGRKAKRYGLYTPTPTPLPLPPK